MSKHTDDSKMLDVQLVYQIGVPDWFTWYDGNGNFAFQIYPSKNRNVVIGVMHKVDGYNYAYIHREFTPETVLEIADKMRKLAKKMRKEERK